MKAGFAKWAWLALGIVAAIVIIDSAVFYYRLNQCFEMSEKTSENSRRVPNTTIRTLFHKYTGPCG